MKPLNRYSQIIEHIFFTHFQDGNQEIDFDREEIEIVAEKLKIKLPKNLGDDLYSFRYRTALPDSILEKALNGKHWIIRPIGCAKYRFIIVPEQTLSPALMLAETKIPDATPGIISMYALNDEQALLAKLRYNRLLDIFTGITCYSLQNHLRTSVPGMGQVETDELYVGIDRRGAHYVFPVQAKGHKDKLNIVQIEQDFAICAHKFPGLMCRAIGAQFVDKSLIALFSFEESENGIALTMERHYRLVPSDELTAEDLLQYRQRTPSE